MGLSGQERSLDAPVERGPRARMRKTLLTTAMGLMEEGLIPSVSEVAEAAEVSRATAYRYFPTQAAIIQAAVEEALGPILAWSSDAEDAGERVAELLAFAYPRIEAHETIHRATLLLALDQWRRRQAGTLGEEEPIKRGNRRELLREALKPLRDRLGRQAFDRLAQSLSLIFGTEPLIILKDIWGLDGEEARKVAIWAAEALVQAGIGESTAGRRAGAKPAERKAARSPRRKRKTSTSQ